jgi:hypothetical protein
MVIQKEFCLEMFIRTNTKDGITFVGLDVLLASEGVCDRVLVCDHPTRNLLLCNYAQSFAILTFAGESEDGVRTKHGVPIAHLTAGSGGRIAANSQHTSKDAIQEKSECVEENRPGGGRKTEHCIITDFVNRFFCTCMWYNFLYMSWGVRCRDLGEMCKKMTL